MDIWGIKDRTNLSQVYEHWQALIFDEILANLGQISSVLNFLRQIVVSYNKSIQLWESADGLHGIWTQGR